MPVQRPPQLEDAEWLAKAYRDFGDRLIADELQVSRSAVRAARKRLGIESKPAGRRPVWSAEAVSVPTPVRTDSRAGLPLSLRLVEERAALWKKHKVPPSETMLILGIKSLQEYEARGEYHAMRDALIDIAAAALRVFEHECQLHANGFRPDADDECEAA